MLQLLFVLCTCASMQVADEGDYKRFVAPIVLRNCVPCHYAGGPGPFPLTTFVEVSKHARLIAEVTASRFMPPQRNDPNYRSFAHERRLSDSEITAIGKWARGETLLDVVRNEADVVRNEADVVRNEADVSIAMRSRLRIPGTNAQTYYCYAIPFEFTEERWVRGIHYVPGNRTLSHHASYQVLEVAPDISLKNVPEYFQYTDSQFVDDNHDYEFFNLVSQRFGPPIETFHGGWLPGMRPLLYPEGIGFRLPKRGVLLIRNLHYAPTPKEDWDSAHADMWFGKDTSRTIVFAAFAPRLAPTDRFIPADTVVTHHIYARIRDSISVLNINPHMHLLGRTFRVWAETPKGDTIPLVYIPDWDFDWQEFYQFKRPVVIPAGSVLNAEATFDNTAQNKRNPFHPARSVPFEAGMDDTNEMMRLVLLVLPYRNGDENINLD
ncbi:MAG: hypothetical protein SGJ05_03585 [bacterium]|nr:hypothetical protein [bacterium]